MDDESEWMAVDSDSPEKGPPVPLTDTTRTSSTSSLNQLTSPTLSSTALETRQSTRVEKRKAEGGKEAYAKETAESVAETQRNASQAAKETRTKQVSEEHHWQQLATKLKTEPAFKALYIAGSRIFASLEADLNTGREITKTKSKEEKMHLKWTLTMAAKWAPTLQCNHDRRTNISTGIALVM
ncbi:hypothetical protein FRC04_002388 [Tulasnella sp. 424]|nr:hypothetical protein FRC04_002388 [Tulasnella sp. 424]